MANIISQYTLDQIVQETMLTLPESQSSDREYDRFLNFAVNGLRHLRMTTTKDGKTIVKITPNSLNRFSFPDDMEEFIWLGVPVNGTLWLLTKRGDMIPTKTVSGLEETQDSDYGEGVLLPVSQYNTFTSQGGVNLEGYYTLDYENREIVINNNRKTELFLAYETSGIVIGSTTNVPAKYVEAIKAWIFWKDVEYDRTFPENKKDSYEMRFNRRKTDILILEGPALWEIYDAWNSKSITQ